MFLDERLTASAIAKRLDLPAPLVRQQILDAVLLALAAEAALRTRPVLGYSRPDPAQERAAAHRGSPFHLQAGPGTGKTSTLAKRILSLLEEGVDAASILVLTFSNKAAGELAERVAAAAPDKAAADLGSARFTHSDSIWSAATTTSSIFRRTRSCSIAATPSPCWRKSCRHCRWCITAISGIPALVLKDVLGAISRAKDELVDAAGYQSAGREDARRRRPRPERTEGGAEMPRNRGISTSAMSARSRTMAPSISAT